MLVCYIAESRVVALSFALIELVFLRYMGVGDETHSSVSSDTTRQLAFSL